MAITKRRGEKIYCDLTVKNIGTVTIPAGYLYIQMGEPGGWSGQFNGVDFFGGSLAPGASISRTVSFTIPSEVPNGLYDILYSIQYPDGNTIGYDSKIDAITVVTGAAYQAQVTIDKLY